jgi:transcriptional regulator with XRE-family HTH domain
MTVGTVLKQAREQAGLSAEQISERTKIQLYKIEALEDDDFSRLPEGIYLDGIIQAYSREVGINSEAMVVRARIERGKRPGDWEVPFSAPIDLRGASRPNDRYRIDVPESDDQLGSFATERQTADAPAAPLDTLIVEHSSWVNQPINAPSPAERQDLEIARTQPLRPRNRRGRSVFALLAFFAAAFLGAYIYESNRALDRSERAESAPRPATDVEIATPKTESPPSADVTGAPPNAASQDAAVPPATRKPGSSQDRSVDASPSTASPNVAAEPARAASTARPGNVATSGTVPNVAGSWSLRTQVESSSDSRDADLQLGYEIRLEQKGDRVTGSGRKITENGNDINPPGQTPLSLSGTIVGDRLTLNFVERGDWRPTRGKFVLILDEAGRLRGRFSSTAAQSSGLVEADRVSTP